MKPMMEVGLGTHMGDVIKTKVTVSSSIQGYEMPSSENESDDRLIRVEE